MRVIDYVIYKLVSGQSLTDNEHRFFSFYYHRNKIEVRLLLDRAKRDIALVRAKKILEVKPLN